MKEISCCIKWRDISNNNYAITFPGEALNETSDSILFDKRRVRYCPECGRPLYTYWEIFKKLLGQ